MQFIRSEQCRKRSEKSQTVIHSENRIIHSFFIYSEVDICLNCHRLLEAEIINGGDCYEKNQETNEKTFVIDSFNGNADDNAYHI